MPLPTIGKGVLDHGGQVARPIVGDSDINEFAEWQKDNLSLRQGL
jgi:hypothetical protein